MQKRSSGNSTSSKINKTKNSVEYELPKINKSFFQDMSEPMSLKFHWLTLDKDYTHVSNHQIELQYNTLRKELISLNEIAVRNIEKLNLNRSYVKKKMPGQIEKAYQVSQREIQNNNSIITRLRHEYEHLQKRVAFLEETNKDQLSSIIQQTKQKIISLRIKNKQIQKKSKDIGNNIENVDDYFNQIKQLQFEKDIAERKRQKLKEKTLQVQTNIQKLSTNLSIIDGGAQQAAKYIQQQLQEQKAGEAGKQINNIFKKRTNQIGILSKNKQSLNHIKQQRYHQALKQLETLTKNIEEHLKNIHISQEKDIAAKKYKIWLEQQLVETKMNKKSQQSENSLFYTQIVEFQEKSSELSKKEEKQVANRIGTIKHYKGAQKPSFMKVTNNTISQRIRQHQKSKLAQKLKQSKTENVRNSIQSSKSKVKNVKTQTMTLSQTQQKIDKTRYNNTILFSKRTTDRKSIDPKRQSQTKEQSRQILPNSISHKNKFNTVEITNKLQPAVKTLNKRNNSKLVVDKGTQTKEEKQNKPQRQSIKIMKQSKIVQEIERYEEDNYTSIVAGIDNKSKIQEQIESSNLSEISDFNSKQSQQKKQAQPLQKRLLKVDQVIALTPKKDEQEHENDAECEQHESQNDADLQQFKKSITAQKQNMNLDKQLIKISLNEIQDTIKRNEMQSKLRKYSPNKSIHEEQQSLS